MLDPESIDIDELIAQATAEADDEIPESDDSDPAEDGPSEEGELSDEEEDEDEGEDPQDEGEEDLAEDEEEDEEDDEDEADDPDEDAEESEPEAEDEAPPEPEPNSHLEELKVLREELRAEREARERFQAELLKQSQPKKQAPAPLTTEQVNFRRALSLLKFGGPKDEDEFNAIPARERDNAKAFLKFQQDREIEYALNPEQRFHEVYRPLVEKAIEERMAPIMQERHDRQAQEALKPHLEKLKTPEDRQRVHAIMQELPGADSSDWGTLKKVLALAVEKFQWEQQAAALAKKEQTVEAKERQQKANKKARKRGSARGRRGSGKKRRKVPDMKLGEDLEAYANRIARGGYELT